MESNSACIDPYVRCAFYGACLTAFGFENVCVVAHSPQGCQLSADVAFTRQQADYTMTERLCSKLCEDEIVHGGEETLKKTILDAQSYKVPLVFVISACGPEIVGDNIMSVAEEMESVTDFCIVPVRAPGFLGSQYKGVDITLETLMNRFFTDTNANIDVNANIDIRKNEKEENTVCILAPHVSGNPTWQGDLYWVKTILSQLNVEVKSVLTCNSTLEDLKNLSMCDTCIVLSHDAGRTSAQLLQNEGVEWLAKDIPLPIGFENIRRFLKSLGTRFDSEKIIDNIIEKGEKTVIQNLRRRGLEVEFFHKVSIAVVADSTIGIPLLGFLTEDLEMIPELVLLHSDGSQDLAEKEVERLHIDPELQCGVEVYQVKKYLEEVNPTCVVGSNIEKHLSKELGIPLHFEVISPVLQYRMTDRAYFGYTGMLNLIEVIQNQWWDRWKSKKTLYHSKW
ncbi:MAG: nitrogenase associated protein [Theionarchaea archaeon]|nr:nitrogenase associated protein [Theionarchaea archaeon]